MPEPAPFLDIKLATIDSVKTDKTKKTEGITSGGDLLMTLRIRRPQQGFADYRPFMELLAAASSLEQEVVSARLQPHDEQQLRMFDGYSVIERLAQQFREDIAEAMPEGTSVTISGSKNAPTDPDEFDFGEPGPTLVQEANMPEDRE